MKERFHTTHSILLHPSEILCRKITISRNKPVPHTGALLTEQIQRLTDCLGRDIQSGTEADGALSAAQRQEAELKEPVIKAIALGRIRQIKSGDQSSAAWGG